MTLSQSEGRHTTNGQRERESTRRTDARRRRRDDDIASCTKSVNKQSYKWRLSAPHHQHHCTTTNHTPAFYTATNHTPAFYTTTNHTLVFYTATNHIPVFCTTNNHTPVFYAAFINTELGAIGQRYSKDTYLPNHSSNLEILQPKHRWYCSFQCSQSLPDAGYVTSKTLAPRYQHSHAIATSAFSNSRTNTQREYVWLGGMGIRPMLKQSWVWFLGCNLLNFSWIFAKINAKSSNLHPT